MPTFHEDTFYEFFRPYRHPKSSQDVWGGQGLEGFGKDLELIRSLDAAHLWTVIDGDGGSQWIVSGYHYVNSVCHLVTVRPHGFAHIEFRISRRLSSLTPLGLRRQISQLTRLLRDAA